MFTKKYVGPVDCASCEKGIVNLNGLRAENVAWNRLPFREPNERIARVSKITFHFKHTLVRSGIQQVPCRNLINGSYSVNYHKS